MAEDRLSNDNITNDILDNNISLALEKYTILSEMMSLIKIQKMYSIKPQTHSNPTSAIEAITDKIKSPDIDTIYHLISNSEATNVDRGFITSILNNLESQNVISINQQPRATIRKKKIHKT